MTDAGRRRWLAGASTFGLAAAGCSDASQRWIEQLLDQLPALPSTAWVGNSPARGHRLRQGKGSDGLTASNAAVQRSAAVIIVGGGVAGLAAARSFAQQGIADVHLLELEDSAGGNSRGHQMGGMACPLGAHYLPLPGPDAHEVSELLHHLGLLRQELGRTVADERHLCHSPQERLLTDGQRSGQEDRQSGSHWASHWVEGLLPPADPGSSTALQYQRFAQAVVALSAPTSQASGARVTASGSASKSAHTSCRPFTLPSHRALWSAQAEDLNRQSFAHWLDSQQLTDPALRWYLDYCCRDDYGATSDVVSAWAGVHYFASRHGFSAPGSGAEPYADQADQEPVFTWPEGNAWLTQRIAQPLQDRIHTARTVLRITEARHQVQVLAFDERQQRLESWQAPLVVMAVPLFVAARLLESPPDALRQAAALLAYSPWLVANLHLHKRPLQRTGAPPCWDNVVQGGNTLGYVDAMHQSLRPDPGATVFTLYHALPPSQRAALLQDDTTPWRDLVLQALAQPHPNIADCVSHIDLTRWGHAMAIPRPGSQRHPALQALRQQRGRLRFAHADLAGYSVFEEAYVAGCEAADRV